MSLGCLHGNVSVCYKPLIKASMSRPWTNTMQYTLIFTWKRAISSLHYDYEFKRKRVWNVLKLIHKWPLLLCKDKLAFLLPFARQWGMLLCMYMPSKYLRIQTCHYSDVIMDTMASQIISLTIVYATVYSGADQRKHQSSASLAFVRGIGEFPAQMASNAENVSIWWRHHRTSYIVFVCYFGRDIQCSCSTHRKLQNGNQLGL